MVDGRKDRQRDGQLAVQRDMAELWKPAKSLAVQTLYRPLHNAQKTQIKRHWSWTLVHFYFFTLFIFTLFTLFLLTLFLFNIFLFTVLLFTLFLLTLLLFDIFLLTVSLFTVFLLTLFLFTELVPKPSITFFTFCFGRALTRMFLFIEFVLEQ